MGKANTTLIFANTHATRDLKEIVSGSPNHTFSFPLTIVVIREHAFCAKFDLRSVRLNEGLETLGAHSFEESGLRTLILPASVSSVGASAFAKCEHLEHVDLRNAIRLNCLGENAFRSCKALRNALLGDGMQIISHSCFKESGLEKMDLPHGVEYIRSHAFEGCSSLRHVNAATSALKTVKEYSFHKSGLEEFVAPPSLYMIGYAAFSKCTRLWFVDLSKCLADGSEDDVEV